MEMLGVGRNFWTSGFGVSFIWTNRVRIKDDVLKDGENRLENQSLRCVYCILGMIPFTVASIWDVEKSAEYKFTIYLIVLFDSQFDPLQQKWLEITSPETTEEERNKVHRQSIHRSHTQFLGISLFSYQIARDLPPYLYEEFQFFRSWRKVLLREISASL